MRAREALGAGPDTGARSDRLAHQLPRARGGRTDRAERAVGRLRRPAREGRTASLAHISDDISRPYLGSYISQGRQHVNHLERSRQRIADGVALARALNRTVVLPTLWCEISPIYTRDIHPRHTSEIRPRHARASTTTARARRCYCDKYWHRLDQCAIPSATSSQPLPFVCPMDHVIDPAW